MDYVADNTMLSRNPDQWAKIDALKVSQDSSVAHVMYLIIDAKKDLAALFAEVDAYRDRFGPLNDETPHMIPDGYNEQ